MGTRRRSRPRTWSAIITGLLVAESHRPTLREELAGMSARPRIAAIVVLAALALGGIMLLARGAPQDGVRTVIEKPLAFNLRYPGAMRKLKPHSGEYLHLQRKGLDEFIVEPLKLPAYQGDVSGALPVQASRERVALKQRFPELDPVEEGKVRLNRVVGYSLVFRASRSPRRYGRLVLLPTPGRADGVKLLMLATPDAGAEKARDVGTRGELQTPYRTFRFGTEAP